jgi:DNA-binding response OmpR family regulator
MQNITETSVKSRFPGHVNLDATGGNTDFSSCAGRADAAVDRRRVDSNSTTSVCPCCGAELKNQRPHVDLNSNVFVFRGQSLSLSPTQAELMETLCRRSPGIVAHDTIIRHVWGRDEPADPRKNIHIHVHNLQPKLKPFGVSIVNVLDVGYRVHFEEVA